MRTATLLILLSAAGCSSKHTNEKQPTPPRDSGVSPTRESSDEQALRAARQLRLNIEDVQELHREKALDPATLLQLDPVTQTKIAWDQRHSDHPGAAVRFRLLQESIGGPPPPGALEKAILQAQRLRARKSGLLSTGLPSGPDAKSSSLLPPEAGLTRPGWKPIRSGQVGGRTRALIVLDAAGRQILAASPSGGIWRTDDGGDTWLPADDFMANLAVSTLAQSPATPTTVFAGTGEGYYNADAIRGAGIFRSDDAGVTWTRVRGTDSFAYVNRLAVSSDGTTVLAATRDGIERSTDGGRSWRAVATASGGLFDVSFEPRSNTNAVASGKGRVLVTRNGGADWVEANGVPQPSGRIEITYAAANPRIVYASIESNGGVLARSDDGGLTFAVRSQRTNYLGDQGWYGNAVWAGDPTNPDVVVVGGVDVWRSHDGGKTLQRISVWYDTRSTHADQHAIVSGPSFDGTSVRSVWVGNDGGVYRVDDINTVKPDSGWTSLNHDYGATQFYAVAVSPKTGTLIGGTQDNGTLRYSAEDGWSEMYGGDGGQVQAASDGTFYGEYVYLNIHRSTDDGKTSEYISGQFWDGEKWKWRAPPHLIPDAKDENANFIAPFVVVPGSRATILAGGRSLWRTRDADAKADGPSWESIKGPGTDLISAIAVSPSDPNIVWVCNNDGTLYFTHDAQAAQPKWAKAGTKAKNLPAAYCHHIELDPRSPKIVYATFGADTNHNVWKSADEGFTWTEIGTTLPAAPVRSLAIHPTKSDYLYVATDVGVFGTENGGRRWSATNEGPTSCAVDGFVWVSNKLYAATHGRGVFSIDL